MSRALSEIARCVICWKECQIAHNSDRPASCSSVCEALARVRMIPAPAYRWPRRASTTRVNRPATVAAMMKLCVICGEQFRARNSRHKTCSTKCSRELCLQRKRLQRPRLCPDCKEQPLVKYKRFCDGCGRARCVEERRRHRKRSKYKKNMLAAAMREILKQQESSK